MNTLAGSMDPVLLLPTLGMPGPERLSGELDCTDCGEHSSPVELVVHVRGNALGLLCTTYPFGDRGSRPSKSGPDRA